jgi:hypothetical protein
MVQSKLKLKVLGLCALALGLMAVGSVGVAQAEPGAYWGYLNAKNELVKFGPTLEPVLGFEIEELKDLKDPGKHLVLLTEILKQKVAILCGELLSDLKLKAEGLVLGLLTFHKCIFKINGVTAPACEPKFGGSKGLIKTLELDGLIELHELKPSGEKHDIVVFEPDIGSNAIAHIELGEECALGEEILLNGELAFQDCQKEFLVHKVVHLWEEFVPLTKLWVISNTLEHKTTIDGSVNVFLTGEHLGLKWAGTPA